MAICEPPTIESPGVAHEVAQIVRNWPDERHTTGDYISDDPLPSFCAVGCILESSGWDWYTVDPSFDEIEEFLCKTFGLSHIDLGSVIVANDDHGKLAAADVIEREWR